VKPNSFTQYFSKTLFCSKKIREKALRPSTTSQKKNVNGSLPQGSQERSAGLKMLPNPALRAPKRKILEASAYHCNFQLNFAFGALDDGAHSSSQSKTNKKKTSTNYH
jgi:hypothetical protein